MRPYAVKKSTEYKPAVIRPMSDAERQASKEREAANASKKDQ